MLAQAIIPAWEARWRDRAVVAGRPDMPGLFLSLAPMDGVTCAVYRALLTGLHGGASGISLCVSEFVRVTRDPVPAAVLRRDVPELLADGRTPSGVPVHVQLLGGDAAPIAATARTAASLGALGVDINFGCPAKTVNNHDGGATLLKYPHRLTEIVARTRDAVPPDVPVTAKMRVGWDHAEGIAELAAAAAAGGAAWITIHARTRTQQYHPPVVWSALAHAAAAVRVPVVANGDLRSAADMHACAGDSQCEAFMIGRGAMAWPAMFAQVRGWPVTFTRGDAALLLQRYHDALLASGATPGRALARVKQWLRMAALMTAEWLPVFSAAKSATEWAPAHAAIVAWANAEGDGPTSIG